MKADFDLLLPLGTKEAKRDINEDVVFKQHGLGMSTDRDSVVYNFEINVLKKNIKIFSHNYNIEVNRYSNKKPVDVDNFVDYQNIIWSRNLKRHMTKGDQIYINENNYRIGLYRPFIKQNTYLADIVIDEPGYSLKMFPTFESEKENLVICSTATGNTKDFQTLMVNCIPDRHLTGDSQCFPLYTYSPDGTKRKDNITDHALSLFRDHYKTLACDLDGRGEGEGEITKLDESNVIPGLTRNPGVLKKDVKDLDPRSESGMTTSCIGDEITKLDIFYYVHALLHHPGYREEYKENLRRSLPHIPLAPDFWSFSNIGRKLADLHINYEQVKQYPLEKQTDRELFSDVQYNVKKMRFSKDKTQLIYNEAITFVNIPKEAHEYKLGNRSALDWIVDQYQVTTDSRSGIVQDPNNFDGDEKYIFDLIGKIVTVSLETVVLIRELEKLEYK